MKITQTPSVQAAEKSPKVKSTDGADPNAFHRMLSDACKQTSAARSAPCQNQTADPLGGLEDAARLARSQANEWNCAEQGMNGVQATLDLLERYQHQLADPRISLKEMMRTVRALEAGINDLRRLEEQGILSGNLARIATEVAVAAQVEVTKFHRGDYV